MTSQRGGGPAALAFAVALVVAPALGGCSSGTGQATARAASTVAAGPAARVGSTTPPAPTSPAGGEDGSGPRWSTYQDDAGRHGEAAGAPAAGDLRHEWTSPVLDGAVYGQPLVEAGRVLVATEADTVYALDAGTGRVLWRQHLGPPVPGSSLPCGDIDPSGITGTPVLDPSSGVLWVVAFVSPGHHDLVGLRAADGSVLSRRGVDPPGADPLVEQQRGALALVGAVVYVPFGGLYGDCGAYHGFVVGLPAAGAGSMRVWQAPTSREGGVWAPPGPVVDSAGDLWVATGNSESTTAFDDGDAVVRLSPDLVQEDVFAPGDWASLNVADADLGSTSPALLPGGRVLQVGKQGIGYLLSSSHAGGVGGELFQARVCQSAFGGTAVSGSTAYVPCRDGIAAVTVGGSGFSLRWHAAASDAGTPVVAGGVVWELGADGTLLGFDQASGAVRARLGLGTTVHFPAVSVAGGQLFAPTGDTVQAFGGV